MADDSDDVTRGLSFRTRLTLALILSAVLPMTAFGLLVLAMDAFVGGSGADSNLARLLLFGLAIAVLLAIFVSYLLAADLTRPLRAIAAAVDRVSAGDLSTPIRVAGDDELARLADSHNRLSADLERRNRELGQILAAIEGASPRDGVDVPGRQGGPGRAGSLRHARCRGDPGRSRPRSRPRRSCPAKPARCARSCASATT